VFRMWAASGALNVSLVRCYINSRNSFDLQKPFPGLQVGGNRGVVACA